MIDHEIGTGSQIIQIYTTEVCYIRDKDSSNACMTISIVIYQSEVNRLLTDYAACCSGTSITCS